MVMGDIIEDVKMVRDQAHHTVLKVGFHNDTKKATVEEFMQTFDIVIVGDGSLCEVNRIISETFLDNKEWSSAIKKSI